MNFRNAFFALALGSSAGAAAALALGPPRGVVLLGRTVDLAFEGEFTRFSNLVRPYQAGSEIDFR